jgi:hypothetical protein
MNLQRLLAENMIRFNTKNLNENQIRKLLREQLSVSGAPKSAVPLVDQFVNNPSGWGPEFKGAVDSQKSILTKNKVPFAVGTDLAAAWIAVYETLYGFTDPKKNLKSIESLKQYIEAESSYDNLSTAVEIQLNESPDAKGKVLTSGIITKTAQTSDVPGEASDINDIIQFCNDYNLNSLIKGITATGVNDEYVIYLQPYYIGSGNLSSKYINPGAKGAVMGGSFVEGVPGKTPGAGSLELTLGGQACIYSSTKFVAAGAMSAGKQITTITVNPGPVVPINASDAFEVLKTQLTANGAQDITTAVTGLSGIGKITNVSIESGASFDEPVKLDNAGFAAKLGLQPNQVPADPTKDVEGEVKDPMSGGNAFLAYMRAEALKNLIAKLIPGVTPTVTAKVAKGGAAARYVTLNITVQKPDGTTEVTKDDLNTVGIGNKSVEGAGIFKIYRYDI